MNKKIFVLALPLLLVSCAGGGGQSSYSYECKIKDYANLGYQNMIGDPNFEIGFQARKKFNDTTNPPASYTYSEYISPFGLMNKPVWGICQWMTQSPVNPDEDGGYNLNFNQSLDAYTISDPNEAKILGFDSTNGDFYLECNCSKEYANDTQEYNPFYGGYWWIHLLIEQNLPTPIYLDDCENIAFCASYEITKCQKKGNNVAHALDSCAQAEWYVTVQDLNPMSADYGKYQWFGFDLFDNRNVHKVSPQYKAGEYGSGVRTTRPSSETYLTKGYQPGVNERTDVIFEDIIEWIRADFEANRSTATENKYWKEDTEFSDLAIASMNIGFEVHDHQDIAIDVSKMGIFYK